MEPAPLFLTTVNYLTPNRKVISQEYAGETTREILIYLNKRFTPTQVETLIKGFPVDSEDKRKTYQVTKKLPAIRLGNFATPKPKEPIMKAEETLKWNEKIKKLREESGLSQTRLNKEYKVNYNIQSGFETGKQRMSLEQRQKFFEILNKPVDESIPVKVELRPGNLDKVSTPMKEKKVPAKESSKDELLKKFTSILESPAISKEDGEKLLEEFKNSVLNLLLNR